MKFEVGDLVRVKPKADIAPKYWYAIGHIKAISGGYCPPYKVDIQEAIRSFTEDELEKI